MNARRPCRVVFACLFMGGIAANGMVAWAQPAEFSQQNIDDAKNSFIFVFTPDTPADRVAEFSQQLTHAAGGSLRHRFTSAIKGFSANMSARAAAQIAVRNPNIAYYEANGIASAFGKPSWAGGDGGSAQVTPWGVAHVGGPIDGSGRHAWVIDTGIDLGHSDLNVGYGANFVLLGKNTTKDGNGHGTHVAGIIGAINNSVGVVGVAAGATVHPVRVLDNSGSGTIDQVIAGVDWVARNAAPRDCANMSLGASGHFQSLHDAVNNAAEKGIYFAIAAGNDGEHAGNYEPAHVEGSNIYTESAINSSNEFASFSNYGNPPIDYAAPGVNILSTYKGGGTATLSGTSMAAPHVCGLLLFSAPPNSSGAALNDPDGSADSIAHY